MIVDMSGPSRKPASWSVAFFDYSNNAWVEASKEAAEEADAVEGIVAGMEDRASHKAHLLILGKSYEIHQQAAERIWLKSEEVLRLKRFGCWFLALQLGTLLPSTERQRRFVAGVNGDIDCSDPDQLLWRRYFSERARWDRGVRIETRY